LDRRAAATNMSSRALIESRADLVQAFAWDVIALAEKQNSKTAGERSSQSPIRDAELQTAIEEQVSQAHQAGFKEGEASGRSKAQAEVRAAIDRLAQSIANIDEFRDSLYRQAEVEAVRLSIAIARRVLRRELTVDPGAIEGLVRAALERLQSQESCRVRVHPDHVAAMRAALERAGMSAKVEVAADPAQEPGAAIFEMPSGNLDASMDSQLREIERGLVDRFQRP
jgi:flagellar assembly protein FliH